ncbi:MAG: MotA/TolQ/ExbB proton channel family protein [Burkholderiaceae bacterium]|nr:MotA/TolQ/ExbB proton channel family protein [Roseateles sp.]MBV8468978.1 MotA/TolQ/ExbB proton channel family protein [Burkholderiaceae bacterium]
MGGFLQFWQQGDAITRGVAALLLLMSVSAWVLILWKGWTLQRAQRDMARGIPAFWSSIDLDAGREMLARIDREDVLLPLVLAAHASTPAQTLASHGHRSSQLTRCLRDALHRVLKALQAGQVVLASIGSTAPFVGLFGTVWGIYHALVSLSAESGLSIDKVSGPVGEALIMTAAGLAVAIPAVLAYNVFGKQIGACEADLEGFAHDLRELAGGPGAGTESQSN